MSTLRVDQITDEEGTGAPNFPNGVEVAGGALAGLADQAEAEAGTDNTKLMTPLRTAQAIAEQASVPPQLTQTQAENPTSTVFGTVSGQRLAQSFDARQQQIGVGQTWQDVSGSRALGTTYQNTTGRPIMVSISVDTTSSNREIQVSINGSTWLTIALISSSGRQNIDFIVPDTWRYRQTGGSVTIRSWLELR